MSLRTELIQTIDSMRDPAFFRNGVLIFAAGSRILHRYFHLIAGDVISEGALVRGCALEHKVLQEYWVLKSQNVPFKAK